MLDKLAAPHIPGPLRREFAGKRSSRLYCSLCAAAIDATEGTQPGLRKEFDRSAVKKEGACRSQKALPPREPAEP